VRCPSYWNIQNTWAYWQDVMQCSPLEDRRFGGTYCLHLQGRLSRAKYLFDLSPLHVDSRQNISLHIPLIPSLTTKISPFRNIKLLLLYPVGSFGTCVRPQQFHSVPRRTNVSWVPLLHFLPTSYNIIRNLRLTDHVALEFNNNYVYDCYMANRRAIEVI
jgi:hypothetical protein